MRHPNEDDGLERLWEDLNKPETKDLAWWKGEVVRLRWACIRSHRDDTPALRWQLIVALDKVMDLERIAGMKSLGE